MDDGMAIADHAFLSDCSSAALVGRGGSINWWCVPRFDSPSVMGRLLDPAAGHWKVHPATSFTADRYYVGESLVLRTTFRRSSGTVAVTDALALAAGARGHAIGLDSPHVLLRRIEGVSGSVAMLSELSPRMEYGRTEPHLAPTGDGVRAVGGPTCLTCTGSVDMVCIDGFARTAFTVAEGETVELRLAYRRTYGSRPTAAGKEASIEDTLAAWESWSALHTSHQGPFEAAVRRSSVVLQGLTYGPSGAVVAAATTSLPERLGGELNFDYRFAWLRDLSLTIRALWVAACPDEPARLFDWLSGSAGHVRDELIQIMYGVEGERT